MPTDRKARSVVLLVALLVAVVVACSKKDDAAPPGTTAAPVTSASVVNTAGNGGGDCTDAVLLAAVQTKWAGAEITEVSCGSPFAAATVRHGAGLAGDGVALLRFKSGAWAVVGGGEVTTDRTTLVPADFSSATYDAWRAKYDKASLPADATTSSRPATRPTQSTIAGNAPTVSSLPPGKCYGAEGGQVIACPTTLPPPTTVPSTLPDGSPAPTSPPVTSQFCRYNYADPRCVNNPEFPG